MHCCQYSCSFPCTSLYCIFWNRCSRSSLTSSTCSAMYSASSWRVSASWYCGPACQRSFSGWACYASPPRRWFSPRTGMLLRFLLRIALLGLYAKCVWWQYQTCRPTSFNRLCTGIDVLWSLLTICAVSDNNNFWTKGSESSMPFAFWEWKCHIIFALGSESSMQWKFDLWNFRSRERKYMGTKVPVTHAHMSMWTNLMLCSVLIFILANSLLNACECFNVQCMM